MLEKSLHTANIAASLGAVATAADMTICGGAASTLGAMLSGLTVFKSMSKPEQALTTRMAGALEAHQSKSGINGDRRILLAQMIKRYPVSADQLARGDLLAETVAANHRVRVWNPETGTGAAADTEHRLPQSLDDFEQLLAAVLRPILDDPAFATDREILRRTRASASYQRMLEAGISEKAIIALAQRYGESVDDVEAAWAGLVQAVDAALELQRSGTVASNHGDFVDQVLARVAELNRAGDFAGGQDAINEALAREYEDHAARLTKLLDTAVAQARLTRDAAAMANAIVRQTSLNLTATPGRSLFDALRAVQDEWYERGRDKGLNLDLEVSIYLAKASFDIAANADQRGAALNDLGTALATLGERESGTDRLHEAVTAYRAALEERTREVVPLDWAATQNNLGNALTALGERESGRERLKEAVAAYRAALEERMRDLAPLDWAATQNNLGAALATLGERESGSERLEEAVAAYRAALEERTRDRVPLDWAATQNNLGNALSSLGERESGTDRLQEAVAAYRAALEEWTRERVPLHWAQTRENMALAFDALFNKTGERHFLVDALAAVGAALEVFREAQAQHYIEMAEQLQADILAKMG